MEQLEGKVAVPTDVSDPAAVDALAAGARQQLGAVHVVCNNAGVGGHGGATWDAPLADSVVDAIRAGRFMVVTDTELATAATAARAGEVEGNDPQLPIG